MTGNKKPTNPEGSKKDSYEILEKIETGILSRRHQV